MITKITIASNPFFEAYYQSDILGKLIIVSLIMLSVCSWVILIHKCLLTYRARKNAIAFQTSFRVQRFNPLALESPGAGAKGSNPFFEIYMVLKKNTLELLDKNRHFSKPAVSPSPQDICYLSAADVNYVEGHLLATITGETKVLEKNLFILATIVSLGPFLGLLGTVWGILTTFSDLNASTGGSTHQAVLGGLSLALATTVLGLIDAIPALIGYNYLKSNIRDFALDMDGFAHEVLSAVEMQYRKVDE